jgi:thiol-disulfide isomerase/thioredoxin
MELITRRTLLAAAGTLTAAAPMRKPRAAELLDMSELKIEPNPAPLPDATFTDAGGADHTLADFRGRGVVLNLWATWCVPCVAEMPALNTLAHKLGDDIVVLPLSSDRGGKPTVERFYAAHEIALPVWLDPKGAAARAWGARGLPTTFIIDREGRVKARLEGGADWANAADMIRKLVG